MGSFRHKLAQLVACGALICGCADLDDHATGMDLSLDGELSPLTPMAAEAKSGDPGANPPGSQFRLPEMPGKAHIAACPVPGYDGSIVARSECDYWVVETFDADTQKLLFYSDSCESGATCNAWVPLGTRVSVHARWRNQACTLLHWRSGFQASEGATCACEQSNDPVCNYVVHENSYCGAVFGTREEM
jgi:hypothetical protein